MRAGTHDSADDGPRPDGLGYEVLTSGSIPLDLPDRLPDGGGRTWAPLSTTLLHGDRDAVLIDPPLTAAQARTVGDRVAATGRRLTHIVATHAHVDHWFTAALLADRFPGAQIVATAGVIGQMHRAVGAREAFWDRVLPGQIPASPVTAVTVPGNRLHLEGHDLLIVEVGHSDTDDTTVVYIPALGLVVAGDVVYDGVHPFLVESTRGGRDSWRRAIDTVAAFTPRRLVAGHRNADREDDPTRPITDTRHYLDDVEELLREQADPVGFYRAMINRHPDHLNPSTLWGSALALYAGR